MFAFSCASTSKLPEGWTEEKLFQAACPRLLPKLEVKGEVWAKVQSPELSGQFPASVRAISPNQLYLEVTNLIGSPQAWMKIENGKVDLKLTPENEKEWGRQSMKSIFAGLPIEFAPDLFLGRIPCPKQKAGDPAPEMKILGNQLQVTAGKTRYLYGFSEYVHRPWPKAVTIEDSKIKLEVEFFSPLDPDRAPLRWIASSPRGRIEVRWKDRRVDLDGKSIKSVGAI